MKKRAIIISILSLVIYYLLCFLSFFIPFGYSILFVDHLPIIVFITMNIIALITAFARD